MTVDQVAEARGLADALGKKLSERDDHPQVRLGIAQRVHHTPFTDPVGPQQRNPLAQCDLGYRRGAGRASAPAPAIGLAHDQNHGMGGSQQALEGRHREPRGSEERESQATRRQRVVPP